MRNNTSKDAMLRCPFCDSPIGSPEDITTKFGNTFSGGRCGCGAVFVYDGSGHSLGEAYVDGLAYACGGDWDKAWGLVPDEDYEIIELSADTRRNKFLTARRGSKSTYLFIRLKDENKPENPAPPDSNT